MRLATLYLLSSLGFAPVSAQNTTFHNPLNADHGSDPWMQYYKGEYYLTATTWSGSAAAGITMKHGHTIAELIAAAPVTVWSDTTASRCCNVWAPEFHLLKGPHGRRWYLYYVAGPTNCCAKQYIHVLESQGASPLGPYAYMGRLFDAANDNWAVDPTVLELKGKLYLLWSGYTGTLFRSNQDIYMMAMRDPWTPTGTRALISEPALAWEKGTAPVNEAPEILSHGKNTWLVFSATWCGNPGYKLGISRYLGGNPLRQDAWAKEPNPVFQAANGQTSTAHNGFFKSPDGREDWIVYHGTTSPKGACDNTRTTRIQKLDWNADGTPNFGAPLDLGTDIPVPSGERRRP